MKRTKLDNLSDLRFNEAKSASRIIPCTECDRLFPSEEGDYYRPAWKMREKEKDFLDFHEYQTH